MTTQTPAQPETLSAHQVIAILETVPGLRLGSYQESVILGYSRWSGADLRGEARRWSGRYAASRDAILTACRRAGILAIYTRGAHGRIAYTYARA